MGNDDFIPITNKELEEAITGRIRHLNGILGDMPDLEVAINLLWDIQDRIKDCRHKSPAELEYDEAVKAGDMEAAYKHMASAKKAGLDTSEWEL